MLVHYSTHPNVALTCQRISALQNHTNDIWPSDCNVMFEHVSIIIPHNDIASSRQTKCRHNDCMIVLYMHSCDVRAFDAFVPLTLAHSLDEQFGQFLRRGCCDGWFDAVAVELVMRWCVDVCLRLLLRFLGKQQAGIDDGLVKCAGDWWETWGACILRFGTHENGNVMKGRLGRLFVTRTSRKNIDEDKLMCAHIEGGFA